MNKKIWVGTSNHFAIVSALVNSNDGSLHINTVSYRTNNIGYTKLLESPYALSVHLMTGGLASLLKAIRLHNHSTASCTPVPVRALHGNTLLSLTFPPFSPSKTRLTKPSFILTTSTQSSRSCLFASISIGTPLASSFCNTLSSTSLHSSRRPTSSFMAASWAERSARVALPTSLLSITNTMAWQLV